MIYTTNKILIQNGKFIPVTDYIFQYFWNYRESTVKYILGFLKLKMEEKQTEIRAEYPRKKAKAMSLVKIRKEGWVGISCSPSWSYNNNNKIQQKLY